MSFGFYLFFISLDFPLLLLNISHKQRIGWKNILPRHLSGILFLYTSRKLISECYSWRCEMLIFTACYQYAPPWCFEDHKKLKMESEISHQYISTDKDIRLVDVKIISINIIQKLGYIFPFKFWIWIPVMVVIYDETLYIYWTYRAIIGLLTPTFKVCSFTVAVTFVSFDIEKKSQRKKHLVWDIGSVGVQWIITKKYLVGQHFFTPRKQKIVLEDRVFIEFLEIFFNFIFIYKTFER